MEITGSWDQFFIRLHFIHIQLHSLALFSIVCAPCILSMLCLDEWLSQRRIQSCRLMLVWFINGSNKLQKGSNHVFVTIENSVIAASKLGFVLWNCFSHSFHKLKRGKHYHIKCKYWKRHSKWGSDMVQMVQDQMLLIKKKSNNSTKANTKE